MYNYQKRIQPGDIIISYRKDGILSRLIWLFSSKLNLYNGRASHVGLCVDSQLVIESLLFKGVVMSNYSTFNPNTSEIIIVRPDFTFPTAFFKSAYVKYLGRKYGWLQIIALLFKRVFKKMTVVDWQPNALICSELICKIYRYELGIDIFENRKCAGIAPVDFLRSSIFRREYDSRGVK